MGFLLAFNLFYTWLFINSIFFADYNIFANCVTQFWFQSKYKISCFVLPFFKSSYTTCWNYKKSQKQSVYIRSEVDLYLQQNVFYPSLLNLNKRNFFKKNFRDFFKFIHVWIFWKAIFFILKKNASFVHQRLISISSDYINPFAHFSVYWHRHEFQKLRCFQIRSCIAKKVDPHEVTVLHNS